MLLQLNHWVYAVCQVGWLFCAANAVLRRLRVVYLRVSVRGHVVDWTGMTIFLGVVGCTSVTVDDVVYHRWLDLAQGAGVIVAAAASLALLRLVGERRKRRANRVTRTVNSVPLVTAYLPGGVVNRQLIQWYELKERRWYAPWRRFR